MAQEVFNSEASKSGIDANAFSCGIYADGASPISTNAKAVLKKENIISKHISKVVSKDILQDADVIFGITTNHARTLIEMFPEYSDKIYVFPIEIADPYGMGFDEYEFCLDQIKTGVKSILNVMGADNE